MKILNEDEIREMLINGTENDRQNIRIIEKAIQKNVVEPLSDLNEAFALGTMMTEPSEEEAIGLYNEIVYNIGVNWLSHVIDDNESLRTRIIETLPKICNEERDIMIQKDKKNIFEHDEEGEE